MLTWYKKLEEKIALLMREEGFESYTVNLAVGRTESIQSKSFTLTSIETVEKETASFRIYYQKKYYSFAVTGFEFLDKEIKNLKSIFNNLEENDYYEESAIYHSPVKVEAHKYVPSLLEMEERIYDVHKILKDYPGFNEEFSTFTIVKSEMFTFNSAGYENHSTIHYSYCYLGIYYSYKDKNGNESQESEWDYLVLTEHMDFKKIIKKMIENIQKYVQKVSIPVGDYKVIFHRDISSRLVSMIVEALYGSSIWHQQSFLKKEDINKPLFSNKITIIEDPMMHGSIYNSPADDSGIPIIKKYLVNQGIVENLLLNREYSSKLEMQPTGNSWYGAIGYTNIYLEPGKATYEELVQHMKTGIVVKSLLGHGLDEATGEISISITGYYIENGEFKGTLNGTINGHVFDILKEVYIANDIIYDQEVNSPSIEVNPMKFAPSSAVSSGN